MARRAAGLVLGLVVVLAGAGCGPAGDAPEDGPTRQGMGSGSADWPLPASAGAFGSAGSDDWWSADRAADLVPTGAELVAHPPLSELVVDGSGGAWMRGGWRVVRVDPATGSSRQWGPGHDRAFAEVSALRPAQGEGVWLLSPGRVRLFDGQRFVRDIEVPADVQGGPDGQVTDVVQAGSRVWVASAAGVASLSLGQWTRWAPGAVSEVGSLAVDDSGAVWAEGRLPGPRGTRPAVVRFDSAGRWDEPAGGDVPRGARELLARPGGGVLVHGAGGLAVTDGTTWASLPRHVLDIGGGAERGTAITADGAVWMLGERGLARLAPGGDWQRLRAVDDPPLRAVAAHGRSLLGLRGTSLVRVAADGSVQDVWTDEGPTLVASPEGVEAWHYWPEERPSVGEALRPGYVVALSATEGWVAPGGYPRPYRLAQGRWQEVPVDPLAGDPGIVGASDGAVWALTSSGLVRLSESGVQRVLPGVAGSQVLAGAEGSVWIVPAWWYGWWYLSSPTPQGEVALPSLVQVRVDGSRRLVPMPGQAWMLTSAVAGPDGSLWVTMCAEGGQVPCPSGTDLMRWDGEDWRAVPYPGQDATAVAVLPDGGLWALLRAADGALPEVGHYREGSWTRWSDLDLDLRGGAAPAPDGSLCALSGRPPELVCIDTAGSVRRSEVPVDGTLSIAPDAAVWLASGGGVVVLVRGAA